jgi:hypothetical protein
MLKIAHEARLVNRHDWPEPADIPAEATITSPAETVSKAEKPIKANKTKARLPRAGGGRAFRVYGRFRHPK